MQIDTDIQKIDEILTRGVDEVIEFDVLKKKLLSGEKLRIKLGIDPTSPHIHLGRATALLKLRDFQNAGHQIVFILGDFTGTVGDTSDKDSERPMLEQEAVNENLKTYIDQASKIIDISKCEIHKNSEWLNGLTFADVSRLTDEFSLNEFSSRELISKRLDAGKRVSLRETLYPIMQGYDSVAIKSDVEIGGTDQRFNMLAGRTLQKSHKQKPQDVITLPLIEGLDGRKMSSSWGNTINLNDAPFDMFGKIMSLRDDLIIKYFTVCTRIPIQNINEYENKLKNGDNPKDLKIILANTIVANLHNEDLAKEAQVNWEATFSSGEIPKDVDHTFNLDEGKTLMDVVIGSGLVSSKTEYRRLLDAGAIEHMEDKRGIKDDTEIGNIGTYRIGKKRFLRIS